MPAQSVPPETTSRTVMLATDVFNGLVEKCRAYEKLLGDIAYQVTHSRISSDAAVINVRARLCTAGVIQAPLTFDDQPAEMPEAWRRIAEPSAARLRDLARHRAANGGGA